VPSSAKNTEKHVAAPVPYHNYSRPYLKNILANMLNNYCYIIFFSKCHLKQFRKMQPVEHKSCFNTFRSMQLNDTSCDYKPTNCTYKIYSFFTMKPAEALISKFILGRNTTCFGQFLCPSSGVFHCTFGTGTCYTGLTTADRLLMMGRGTVRNM
jgi:hypothetical protein